MTLIEVDYRDTIKKADRLEELSAQLNKIATEKLADLKSGMGRNWKGSSSELFQKKTKTLIWQLTSQANNLRAAARDIRKAAENYRRLEQSANLIFGKTPRI